MSRDWDRNFTSTIRETETNLSKIRSRLDPARYKPIDSTLLDSSDVPGPSANNNAHTSVPMTRPDTSEWRSSAVYTSKAPSYELYRHSTPSTGLVALLSEKVDRQNKMLERLSRQVQNLEDDRQKTDNKVRDLEHQVVTLTARLADSGVHLETEHKIDGWQRDVRNRLDELQERLTKQMLSSVESYHSEGALTTLTRDLHETKRTLQAECDALQREIESLRMRLVRQEMDMTGQQADSKELTKRVDRLDRSMSLMSSDKQYTSYMGNFGSSTRKEPLKQQRTAETDIHELKTEMSKLLTTVSKLESSSQVSQSSTRSDPSTISTATITSSRSSKHQKTGPSVTYPKDHRSLAAWQRRKQRRYANSELDSSTSLEDISSSELSLPLSMAAGHEEYLDDGSQDLLAKNGGLPAHENDDFSLSLSDLDGSQKDGDFGSTSSLNSDNLDIDLS